MSETRVDETGGLQPAEIARDDRPSRPTIVIRQELHTMINRAMAVLLGTPELGLYTRSRMLVHVVRESQFGAWDLDVSSGQSAIAPVTKEFLSECLDRAARWVTSEGGKGERDVRPPMWIAKGVLGRDEWDLPRLEGIAEAPIFGRDGSVQSEPGYDWSTGLLFDPGSTEFPPVPERPTRDDAVRAWQELRAPLQDFPFINPSDESALIAAVLSLLGRHAIAGPCPMTAIRAPVPGSGKTLAADAVAILGTGRLAPRMTMARDDDEFRKRILAMALAGTPLVLIDNVEGAFGSQSIAAQLTGDSISERLLGSSQIVSVQFRPVWLVTGNNLEFKGDLGRRVIPCDLDPRLEHPEDRAGFRIPDLRAYLKGHRPRLVVAGLTILRAYHVAGRPAHGRPRKGSFEEWDDLVRGALLWLGAADPVEGQARLREAGDAELEALRAVLGAWHALHQSNLVTVSKILEIDPENESLRLALAELVGCEPGQLTAIKAGCALKRVAGRVALGKHLERAPGRTGGVARWRVASNAS